MNSIYAGELSLLLRRCCVCKSAISGPHVRPAVWDPLSHTSQGKQQESQRILCSFPFDCCWTQQTLPMTFAFFDRPIQACVTQAVCHAVSQDLTSGFGGKLTSLGSHSVAILPTRLAHLLSTTFTSTTMDLHSLALAALFDQHLHSRPSIRRLAAGETSTEPTSGLGIKDMSYCICFDVMGGIKHGPVSSDFMLGSVSVSAPLDT